MNSGNSKTSGSNRFILNQKDKINDLITISLHQTLVFSLKKLIKMINLRLTGIYFRSFNTWHNKIIWQH